jgi:catechol 2,3-dioxygenase-like lactoylglutathione lyase family enzyme
VTVVVREYEEAIAFYVGALGFRLVEDTPIGEDKRWVVVAPSDDGTTALLLAQASTESQEARVGDQTGGRVSFFLYAEDFASEYERLRHAGVTFVEEPRLEDYGTVAVFEDLYRNRWDLIELRE